MESNSLDFKINIQPKSITEHVEPDVDLTVDKYDAVYQNTQQEEEVEAANKDLLIQEYDITQAAHPYYCVAALLLTSIPGLTFILLQDVIHAYPLVIILQLAQFLALKNYLGLKLIGLRWWIEMDIKGEQKWMFQTQSQEQSNKVDKYFFWACLIYGTLFWCIMCLGDFFGFKIFWLPLPIICFVLSLTNLQGFYKCRGEHKKKLQQLKREMAKGGMNIVGMIMK
ncbi:unnamed protein product (macronuclear) [Paramecium tetraurelia]|uniref:Golgi apparatus membrane protein TVP23 homolog n=1 Tax=Paramecium tetraurelia TaxID=5888 RepID=A0E4E3_PARTE|nr:uncharacterized protein GSPATT00023334001 [Paramecium tetraurelia]CAK90160.1 unnamed protein product [Paramecium tetraurelia]|eukprot:XP_001457557.1 hypothetical protein (macronuclear) [Paramecium tetraurelia strain d4-2]